MVLAVTAQEAESSLAGFKRGVAALATGILLAAACSQASVPTTTDSSSSLGGVADSPATLDSDSDACKGYIRAAQCPDPTGPSNSLTIEEPAPGADQQTPDVNGPSTSAAPAEPIPEDPVDAPTPPAPDPVAQGFACESPDIGGLSFLDVGWHNGTEIKWGNIGCLGSYQLGAPHMAINCSSDALNGGWMAYAVNEPPTLEPNFEPDADPDIQYRLWMTNLLWFTDANNQAIAYQLPWTYTLVFAQPNLATGTFHWAHNNQWFNAGGQLVYDQFNPRSVDTRSISTGPARAAIVTYLLYWPASDYNGAGAAFANVPLHGVGYCDI